MPYALRASGRRSCRHRAPIAPGSEKRAQKRPLGKRARLDTGPQRCRRRSKPPASQPAPSAEPKLPAGTHRHHRPLRRHDGHSRRPATRMTGAGVAGAGVAGAGEACTGMAGTVMALTVQGGLGSGSPLFGQYEKARSARAVIVRAGLAPGLAGMAEPSTTCSPGTNRPGATGRRHLRRQRRR